MISVFGICPLTSHTRKFWHVYMIRYSDFTVIGKQVELMLQFSEKTPRNFEICHFPGKTNFHPWKFCKIVCGTHWKFQGEIEDPWKPHMSFSWSWAPLEILLFLIDPWNFHMFFFQYPWKFHVLNPQVRFYLK